MENYLFVQVLAKLTFRLVKMSFYLIPVSEVTNVFRRLQVFTESLQHHLN